jgi:glycosyltransferase involved in cell wall biosynthesis
VWEAGDIGFLGSEGAFGAALLHHAQQSEADYLLLWRADRPLLEAEQVARLTEEQIDIAHSGLRVGMGALLVDLQLITQDWSMLNAPAEHPSTSWRLSLDACLMRRSWLLHLGGLDAAYSNSVAAGLDFGYRALAAGALIEHRPELGGALPSVRPVDVPTRDLYVFLLRHYGQRWAQYVLLRRSLGSLRLPRELRELRRAERAVATISTPPRGTVPEQEPSASPQHLAAAKVSAVIPTLGRYPYLPAALESLRRQTVRPREVIVVDQNPPEARQPEVYAGYDDLNLRVVWQDERGQSLARNTGLTEATCEYVFLFDDDSIAQDDLIETHVRAVIGNRCHISTGVSYPPPPSNYTLPSGFRHQRLSQTFDTGNSLLPLALARRLGGLDRNYDHGPGTDLDFGTRLYLDGQRILHNPQAVRVHFKAPMGGLRTYGVRKYNTDAGLLRPFPHVTQTYYGLRYLSPAQLRERTLIQFLTSRVPPELRRASGVQRIVHAGVNVLIGTALLPLKWRRSYKAARRLFRQGVRIASFEAVEQSSVSR